MGSSRVTPNSEQIKVNVVGSSNFGLYNKISPERTYNMYITTAGKPDSDDFEAWLVNFPGYRRVLNLLPYPDPYPTVPPLLPSQVPQGQGRGIFNCVRGNFAIVVVNSAVYRISSTLGVTFIGNLATVRGEVFMADNLNNQICIVDGVNAYIYFWGNNSPPNLTIQTDPVFTGSPPDLVPNYVEYHNTFFLFGNGNKTSEGAAWYVFAYSTDNGASAIVKYDKLALQTKSDFAIAIKKIPGQGNNVMVFGTTVAEIQTQVNGLSTYIRNPSYNINYGCQSVSTIADSGDVMAWLGINENDTAVIMVADGNGVRNISTDGIDHLLDTLKAPQTSTATMYRQDGHLFYQLTFYDLRDNLTIIYDFNTEMFFHLSDQYFNYHPARQVIFFNLHTYFISLNNAALYEMNSSFTTIDENLYPLVDTIPYNEGLVFDIQRMRITSSIRQGNSNRFRANSFVMTLEQGTDPDYTEIDAHPNNRIITELDNNPSLTPMINEPKTFYIVADNIPGILNPYFNPNIPYIPHIDLSISKDGGTTWGDYVRRDMHWLGHRQNILHWENMGVANDLCFKLRFWGTYRFIVNNALVDIVS